ncbi:hypothetical protein [Aquabacterium olei]|uniref:hypothetical protein n=1 Tax=Aquabacterium olei TaxID=1296669 RepID=UPI00131F2B6B|nr:hypothetical protein [Aquabacterium olei]
MNPLETIISFFERLGVCVAVFAGSAAIIHFKDKVLPFFPTGAVIMASALLLFSFFLCVWVAADFYANISNITNKKYARFILAAFAVVTSLFFLVAGGYASISSLNT